MNQIGSPLLTAVRGPVLLITLGVLFTMDQFGSVDFSRTWPVLIIVFGVLKLMERSATRGETGTCRAATRLPQSSRIIEIQRRVTP